MPAAKQQKTADNPSAMLAEILKERFTGVKAPKSGADLGEFILQQLMGGPPMEFHTVEILVGPKGNGQIILPDGMSDDEGITWLTRKRDAERKEVEVREEIHGFPLDAARAVNLAVKKKYGFSELKKVPGDFFNPEQPPLFITVPVDHKGGVEEVFVGRFSTPMIDGYLELLPNKNHSLFVAGTVRQKSVPEVKALVALAREILKTESLYRGKAVKIDFTKMDERGAVVMPQFWDVSGGYSSLLLNRDVEAQVRASVWNVIRNTQRCIDLGIPLKRGVIFEGDYGTGKTLCANVTARICVEHGWTFIYVPNASQLAVAHEFARRYQPAVLFTEDVDRATQDNEAAFTNQLSNVLDGVDSKLSKVILIMTTNHVENIPRVLLRPGRCDAAIHFSPPDSDTAGRLVQYYAIDQQTGNSLLDPSCNIKAIGKRLDGKIPAIIREVLERAKLHAIDRDPLLITTEDIVTTADMMEHHAHLCRPNGAPPTEAEVFTGSFGRLVKNAATASIQEAGLT